MFYGCTGFCGVLIEFIVLACELDELEFGRFWLRASARPLGVGLDLLTTA